LPENIKKEGFYVHTTVNGISGKQGVYRLDYNGAEVAMSTFYTIQNNKGYVLSAIIPIDLLSQKFEEVKKITQSFIIDGVQLGPLIQNNKTGKLDGLDNNEHPRGKAPRNSFY
jgi:hypothetical protein